jgi:hypothetical protein
MKALCDTTTTPFEEMLVSDMLQLLHDMVLNQVSAVSGRVIIMKALNGIILSDRRCQVRSAYRYRSKPLTDGIISIMNSDTNLDGLVLVVNVARNAGVHRL